MKKYKRRDFIALTAAGIGAAALPACNLEKDNEHLEEADISRKANTKDEIALNREMPRKLVMQLLDQKVNEYMEISNNCAQSTFLALKEQFGLEDVGIVKALTAMPGIAERGETCGTVTGSIMAMGLIYGRGEDRLNDFKAYRDSLIPAGKFCKLFEQEYGSTMCHEIQKSTYGRCYHLSDPDELAKFQEAGATEKCSAVVRAAVHIAADIILDEKNG